MPKNKRKLLNDPVYGFITIPDDLVFDVIEHQYFQRLRRIQQLGLSHYVYPGALHTRFHHAIGAMYLMDKALSVIKLKGTKISEDEYIGAILAILLHDIGHGPFSHALEHTIISGITHEDISKKIISRLNNVFDKKLDIAEKIFQGTYHRQFFHQLVASQLDVDRLDYLTRDSFFTGVSEGIIGTDRIIKMMNVCNNELVIEEKGIYSIEKFLISRQLMYLQVYLHKTVLSAEVLLIKVLQRAHFLAISGIKVPSMPSLEPFLNNKINKKQFLNDNNLIDNFCKLDDFDIIASIKLWSNHSDKILNDLSNKVLNRKLFKTTIFDEPIDNQIINKILSVISNKMKLSDEEAKYYFQYNNIEMQAYNLENNPIKFLYANGKIKNINDILLTINLGLFSDKKLKYYISFPKELEKDIFKIIGF